MVPVAEEQQQQQLAFDFEPDGFAYEEENEFDDSGNFADDPAPVPLRPAARIWR